MTEIQTDPRLLEAILNAAKRGLSAADLTEQRVSFILGSLGKDSTITREQVEKILASRDGRAA